jgi:hypothetical protein
MLVFSIVTIVVGLVITLTLFVRRKHCLANPFVRDPSCGSYTSSIHWAICIIIAGGTFFVIAALFTTNFLQGQKPADYDGSTLDESGK